MNHYTDAELSWHAIEPDPEIGAHLTECRSCAQQYAFIRRIDTGLANPATWQFPVDYRGANDARRSELEATTTRLAGEIVEAREQLDSLIDDAMAFIWQNVARKPRFQTAGAVRVLIDAAHDYLERDPLHARNLADGAVSIARSLGINHYLGRKVHQLIGRALKEKGRRTAISRRVPRSAQCT
jgi:hypothetical protein